MPGKGGRVERAKGVLAFVGGAAWATEGHAVRELVAGAAGKGAIAVVLPTAAAYERPERIADAACSALAALGLETRAIALLRRTDASLVDVVDAIRDAGLIFLTDGSAMHMHSVLKDTPAYRAIVDAYDGGAVLVASGAGGSVLWRRQSRQERLCRRRRGRGRRGRVQVLLLPLRTGRAGRLLGRNVGGRRVLQAGLQDRRLDQSRLSQQT
jgi:hypothetical protein